MNKEKSNGVVFKAVKVCKRKMVSEDPVFKEGEPEYEVQRIVDHHVVQNGVNYLVKWRGWPKECNTWEPEENFANCKEILRNYHKKCKVLVSGSASIGSPTYKAVEEFKKHVGCPTKERMENMMQTLSGRGGLVYKVPREDDIDKRIVQLLELPNDKWDPMVVQDIKNDLQIREFHFQRQEQLKNLEEFEMEMNSSAGKAHIKVENLVDLEIPNSFTYVSESISGEGITIPDDPPIGCECHSDCSPDSGKCCGKLAGETFAYGSDQRLIVPVGTPIYECNKRCKCGKSCLNRVVQNGRTVKLCLFRTKNGCGWGVKALEAIKKGSYVCEYVGEVIDNEEAEERGKLYDAVGCTYLFDLDYNDEEHHPYTIDAGAYGNISRFINHSCEPNLAVFGVWINCLDRNLPKLALFATRNIKENEEITFDYMPHSLRVKNSSSSKCSSPLNMQQSLTNVENREECLPGSSELGNKSLHNNLCKCGSKKCRKYLF